MREITFKIQRFNPEVDKKPYFKEYNLKCVETDRILDCLDRIKAEHDGTLTYRKSCSHGICGSDAVRINGKNALACQVLVQDIKKCTIKIEPLLALPLIKDLVVDFDTFFDKIEVTKPYFINDDPPPVKERYQSVDDREIIDESTQCILCGACSSSCPSSWADEEFLGPAALLKAYRFIFDSRDHGADERLNAIDRRSGIWRCHTIFNCVEACPREINLTWHISQLKKKLVAREL